jgi:HEAT repeat protein
VEQGASGLELRALQDVLAGLREADGTPEVVAEVVGEVVEWLARNLSHESTRRRTVALHLAGELAEHRVEAHVVALLREKDVDLARRAAGVLARIGSHAGDDVLRGWLARPGEELLVMAALGTLLGTGTPVYGDARPLLNHPLVSVRTRLATLLAEHGTAYADAVAADLADPSLSRRARRTLLDVMARAGTVPEAGTLDTLLALLGHADWGMRGDAARVLRGVLEAQDSGEALREAIRQAFARQAEREEEPYVRFWLDPRRAR